MEALADLKVIEVSNNVAGAYCAKLLADYGSEVIKVERPGGGDDMRRAGPFPGDSPDPECSGMFFFLNANKLGITLNTDDSLGKEVLNKLCQDADILILDMSPAEADKFGYMEFLDKFPRLIVTILTPFGLKSPYKDFAATEFTMQHMSGVTYFTPGEVADAEKQPPIRLAGWQVEMMAGLNAAFACLLAVNHRIMLGTGQLIDLAIRDVPIISNIWNLGAFSYTGVQPVRVVGKTSMAPQHILPCKNGYVHLSCNEEFHWNQMVEVLGNPEWAKEELFKDRFLRGEHWESLRPLLIDALKDWDKEKLTEAAQQKGVPCTVVATPADLLSSPQLKHRNFFHETDHPRMGKLVFPRTPFSMTECQWQYKRPAPSLGEHNEMILCGRLGYTKSQLVTMRATGVV